MTSTFPFKKDKFWNKKFRHHLKFRDVDGDGIIVRDDFFIVADRFQEMGASEDALKKLWESGEQLCEGLGLVGKTILNYDQFTERSIAMFEKTGYEVVQASLSIMFDIIDTNGDCVISSEEWATYCKCMGIPQPSASFEAMDADGNGTVSREEFDAYV